MRVAPKSRRASPPPRGPSPRPEPGRRRGGRVGGDGGVVADLHQEAGDGVLDELRLPPARVATTGQPASWASSRMLGRPSISEVRTVTRATRRMSGTSLRNRRNDAVGQAKVGRQCLHRGPLPPLSDDEGNERASAAARSAQARRSTSSRFSGASRPAHSTSGTPSRSRRRRISASVAEDAAWGPGRSARREPWRPASPAPEEKAVPPALRVGDHRVDQKDGAGDSSAAGSASASPRAPPDAG